ncbi:MAG: hypothetical protein OXE92_07145 [Bacteroidetes bacterium]|nr:hypothetical protein [Bacteroidota bacterium]MCY4205481.1 hypothetical protein [Bacteroidota bacterium]
MGSKPSGLRERTEKDQANKIRRELDPLLEATKKNQTELKSCVRQIRRLLHIQQAPWQKAGAMLWGIVMGMLLFALLQQHIQHSKSACVLGTKIMTAWPSLSESERAMMEQLAGQ